MSMHLFVDIIPKVTGTIYKTPFQLIRAPHTIPTPTRVFAILFRPILALCFRVAQSPDTPDITRIEQYRVEMGGVGPTRGPPRVRRGVLTCLDSVTHTYNHISVPRPPAPLGGALQK